MAQYFFTDAGAPTTTPAVKGAIYVDTTNDRAYISTDTASSADWDILPANISELAIDADIDFGGNYKAINLKGLDFQTFTEYTIASGVIAPVQSLASIDTEADASTDDIDTITVATDLNMIGLKMENSARVPTLKHGTGNLSLPNATDVVMVNDVIYWLVYDGSNWLLAFDPAGVALTFPVSDATTLLKGSIDDTKKARLEVDTNTPTATTIVISTPSADFDMEESVRNSTTATTNALPRYTGSGKYIKDSGVLIDDSENLSGVAKISTSDHIELTEIAAPSTPATGKVAVYTKTDGKLYIKDDTGTETDCTGSGGGSSLPVVDTTSIVEDPVDATKEMRIDVGAVSTATVRVLTMPDNDVDLGSDFATAAQGTTADSALQDLVDDTTPQLGGALDTNSNQINLSKGADVASAGALTLGTDGNYFDITGTTTITSIATLGIGTQVTLHFDGALTLTHHATDLILPSGANITTAVGDEFTFVEYASGDWRCIGYALASGEAVIGGSGNFPTATDSGDKTTAYTVVSGDVNTAIIVGSATTADFDITLDVSLFSATNEVITVVNESAYIARVVVSNTGTMTINSQYTDRYVSAGQTVTFSGDTSTNCRMVAGA